MIDVYISIIPGGYKIKCPQLNYFMRYYDYTKREAVQRFRAATALQHKHLNIMEV